MEDTFKAVRDKLANLKTNTELKAMALAAFDKLAAPFMESITEGKTDESQRITESNDT